ncbi:S41 family peptidase [Sunxiuqinia elliptica]|uniref:S41A family C-terminal processing peptidase-3 n=1 Tax=Sunxiuqinia elliptica TaxID=655355 RepID=A0A4R6H4K7_9BACT|nr:S41 family peptidase [Sunxiuqinia elliptica]TDO02787.1 S41A family C-terminal processing peptidase-3 [Sunxiuqinia elliptica]TDO58474.1 S41A family C-terminal processing peptidase-3 [Sunxiuqinia elliptica]
MKRNRKIKTGISIAAVLVVFALVLSSFNRDEKLFLVDKNLDIYYTLVRELNLFYVDEINPTDLVKTSIDKMLESLDPYTNYIPESDMEDFRFMTTGEYAGVGALISKHGDEVVIAEPYEGFPAQKAGLKAGDILREVAGKSTEKLSTEDVSNLLKGPANKVVRVKVERPGKKKNLEIDILREKIQIDAVPYYGMLDDETGYIRLSNFTKDCGDEVKKAFVELKEQKGAKSLVLDLRSNPGGLLMESVKIVNLFVPKGSEVVSTKGKVKQWDKTYKATEHPIDTVMPMAVLVNRGSASASEIVAGALQDLDRAVIIGTRTFGKGLVQTTRDLSYNTKLKVTTAKYYIPSGRCIQALDYSHRNEDGSVGTIPDSLITEFTTKKGRKVYDGGGIVPDQKIDLDRLSSLSINLVRDFMFFDYATKFANEHESIAAPEEFEITDAIFNDFKTFVKERKFSYQSETEEMFKKLLETAKEERYYDVAEGEFEALKVKIGHELDKDLESFKEEVKEMLTDEIVTRYYYQKGAIKSAIREDKGIDKAKEILHNPQAFGSVFTKGKIISMNIQALPAATELVPLAWEGLFDA